MPDFISEIEAALASNSPIPKDEVLKWIAAAGNDLRSLAKLNLLTNVAYYRIQPELGKETTCALIQRYLLECVRQNVQYDDEIEPRFNACMSLVAWFNHLLDRKESEIIAVAARAVTDFYLKSDPALRNAIETGFLEHALETPALRPYFEFWSRDERLQDAWKLCLEWGEAHPGQTRRMFQQLREGFKE